MSGFLLVVEGGLIDHAHHDHKIRTALEETIELEAAVRTVLDMVDTEETLGRDSMHFESQHYYRACLKGFGLVT